MCHLMERQGEIKVYENVLALGPKPSLLPSKQITLHVRVICLDGSKVHQGYVYDSFD